MAQSIWTCEAINIMKDLFAARNSAAIIADELTARFKIEFTRNGVLGKIHRLHMGKKKMPIVVKPVVKKKILKTSAPRARNVIELFEAPRIDIEKTPPLKLRIDQLDNDEEKPFGRCDMCRYPYPDRDEFGGTIFCGLPTGGKSSWCSYHRKFMTQAVRGR